MEEIMNSRWKTAAAVTIGSMAFSGAAAAQERDRNAVSTNSDTLAPASDSVELTVGTGYAQGFGDVGASQPTLTDVGQPGGALQIGVGYRLIPQLSLGIYGSGAMFSRGDQVDASSNLYSATAGVDAAWHFLPSAHELDPWVSLGTGWRGYWIHGDQGTTSLQGLQLAKLNVGLDYRATRSIAVSPVIGADLSMFLSESSPLSNGFSNIVEPKVNTFVFGGVQGRFDIPVAGGASSHLASR
jgi:hypothetical protein